MTWPTGGAGSAGTASGGGPGAGPGQINVEGARLGPCRSKAKFGWGFVYVGTEGDDTITGSKDNDVILAGGGNDRASGGDRHGGGHLEVQRTLRMLTEVGFIHGQD